MAKNSNKNKSYPQDFKDSILKRLEQGETVASLADELDIPKSTIYQWVRTNNKKQKNYSINLKSKKNWTSEDKFQVVLETSTLTERELAEYCRRKGIYVDEVKSWRDQCLKANQVVIEDPKELKDSLKQEKDRVKILEKELRFKDKALAETAALLVLRKKANAIWGDPEEE
jgi:transposase-like protein